MCDNFPVPATKCSNEAMYNIPLVHGNSHSGLSSVAVSHIVWMRFPQGSHVGNTASKVAMVRGDEVWCFSTEDGCHRDHNWPVPFHGPLFSPPAYTSARMPSIMPKHSQTHREQRRPLCLGSSVSQTDLNEFICFIKYLASGTVL